MLSLNEPIVLRGTVNSLHTHTLTLTYQRQSEMEKGPIKLVIGYHVWVVEVDFGVNYLLDQVLVQTNAQRDTKT